MSKSRQPTENRLRSVERVLRHRAHERLSVANIASALDLDPRAIGAALEVLLARGRIVASDAGRYPTYAIKPSTDTTVAQVRVVVYRGELRHYDSLMRAFAARCLAGR
ncbi:hypothetical protein [Cupriavidus sp. AcVe19-6a]|uniref:hypothetical protein n=1 Tax=Cupriavidus sp. AcVe19-6a TaxID=2821358 RepID=UPI001AE46A11|nr:hypothetical protein [Cupriavidus sp. AcVe19-6a]MBP0634887.1 hypothetical protein [Cupriavidus sp. AcVe19-6a]